MTTATHTHTPGPWEITVDQYGNLDVTMEGAGDMLADLKGCPNAEANARLIAAAPDLLAALEALRGDLLRYPNDDARREAIVNAAEAAIAAARGDA